MLLFRRLSYFSILTECHWFGNTPPNFLTINPTTGDIYGTDGTSIFKILKNYTSVYILATSLGSAPVSLGSNNSPQQIA